MSFAVIKTGGKQYKVKASEILKIEKLNKENSGKIEFNSVIEEKIGENYFLITGIYTFKFKRNKEINARFTFLINPMIEKPIKHHHSSQIPA